MNDNDPTDTDTDTTRPWWRTPRWRYAGVAFLVGVAETGLALLTGVEVRWAGRDVTLWAGGVIEVSFAVFGYLLGRTVEARRRERRQAAVIQEQLRRLGEARARVERSERLASLGELAGAIVHEVRNPLTILRSMVQNLREELADDAPREEPDDDPLTTCDELVEEIDRLDRVTASLSTFSRAPQIDRRRIRLGDWVDRVRLLADELLAGRDVRLQTHLDDGDAALDADPDLLSQVLLQLLDNGAHASPAEGEIHLVARGSAEKVVVEVVDQGPGLPRDADVFEPFYTTRAHGHGLGLAVARRIVEAHGGTLESAPSPAGFGACLRIELPAEDGG